MIGLFIRTWSKLFKHVFYNNSFMVASVMEQRENMRPCTKCSFQLYAYAFWCAVILGKFWLFKDVRGCRPTAKMKHNNIGMHPQQTFVAFNFRGLSRPVKKYACTKILHKACSMQNLSKWPYIAFDIYSTVLHEIFAVKNFLAISLTDEIKHAKYFLRRIFLTVEKFLLGSCDEN